MFHLLPLLIRQKCNLVVGPPNIVLFPTDGHDDAIFFAIDELYYFLHIGIFVGGATPRIVIAGPVLAVAYPPGQATMCRRVRTRGKRYKIQGL